MITVQPPANVTDNTLFACVDFTVGDQTRQVYLRQEHGVVPVLKATYGMDGVPKSFGIRSEHDFKVTVNSNPNNVLTLSSQSGLANTSAAGEPVNFTLYDDMANPTLFERDVVLTISSDEGKFPDRVITLKCTSNVQPLANCYIVAPGSDGILIPVARCNESDLGSTRLGSNEAFTAELVWTDNILGVNPASNIKQIATVGTGSGGYLLVKPGTAPGNAVVCIKKSGAILWSWHVWVTDYVPVPVGRRDFMDRNLGATTNTPGAFTTFGLFYQWGRKDPFPGSASATALVEPDLYTASGTVIHVGKVQAPTASTDLGNLGVAVANPLTFFYTLGQFDWFDQAQVKHNHSLWSSSVKKVYDPCPPGWRVPASGDGALSPWNGMDASNFPWDDAKKGCTSVPYERYGGFYPGTGMRHRTAGNLERFPNIALHAATNYDNAGYSRSLYYDSSNSTYYPHTYGCRGDGFSVRCVAE
jgi:hypothetical protein